MFHVCSLVCCLIYGVKRRQVLIAKPFLFLLYFSDCTSFIKQIYDLLTNSCVLVSKLMIFKIHTRETHGTHLGNIYGIYKECITNISMDIYDIK